MSRHDRAADEVARIRALLNDAGVELATPPDRLAPQDLALLQHLLSAPASSDMRTVRAPRGPVRTWAPRLAVAAVLVGAVTTVGLWWPSSTPPADASTPPVLVFSELQPVDVLAGETRPATETLEQVADAADAQDVAVGSGTQEVTSYAWFLNQTDEGTTVVPTFVTTELRPDGSVTSHEARGAALTLDGDVLDPLAPPLGGTESFSNLLPATLDPARASSLPRDPEALTAALIDHYGGASMCEVSDEARAACLGNAVVDLTTTTVVPADLSAALWRALAAQPAMVDLGSTTDRVGRDGVAVAVPPVPGSAVQQTRVLVIDPDDGHLLEWDWVSDGVPGTAHTGPTLIAFQAYMSSRWVP